MDQDRFPLTAVGGTGRWVSSPVLVAFYGGAHMLTQQRNRVEWSLYRLARMLKMPPWHPVFCALFRLLTYRPTVPFWLRPSRWYDPTFYSHRFKPVYWKYLVRVKKEPSGDVTVYFAGFSCSCTRHLDAPVSWPDPMDIDLVAMPGLEVVQYSPSSTDKYPMTWPTPDYLKPYGARNA